MNLTFYGRSLGCAFVTLCLCAGVSAQAATVPFTFQVTYDIFLGGAPTPTALTVPASNSGSGSFSPFGAVIWSETGTATFAILSSGDVALSTVSLNFMASFNGGADTITGTDFHVTGVSQTMTITGGTGIFSGAAGFATPTTIEAPSSGNPAPGFGGTLSTSGSGQITAPGLTAAPEPAMMALFSIGLAGLAAVMAIRRRRSKLIQLMTSLKWRSRRVVQRPAILTNAGVTACLLMAAFTSSAPAATISISYNLSGGPTGPPVMSGTTLILDGLFTGSVLSGNPALNAVWNPVTYSDHSVADLTTGLLTGTFSMTFADGDVLSGTVFEDVSALIASGGTGGSYTQALMFTGGTGQFAGATGSTSGGGVATNRVSTVSGTGTLTAAGIAPEPASVSLILGGLLAVVAAQKLVRKLGSKIDVGRGAVSPLTTDCSVRHRAIRRNSSRSTTK